MNTTNEYLVIFETLAGMSKTQWLDLKYVTIGIVNPSRRKLLACLLSLSTNEVHINSILEENSVYQFGRPTVLEVLAQNCSLQ